MSSLDFLVVPPQSPAESADSPVVLVVTTDTAFAQQLIQAISQRRSGPPASALPAYHLPRASNLAQARTYLARVFPSVIFLDDRVAEPGPLADALQSFSHFAPLVVLAGPDFLAGMNGSATLGERVRSGRLDIVVRAGEYLPLLVRLIERHVGRGLARNGASAPGVAVDPAVRSKEPASSDFGETLRHEVNNPLTGILGNAELLLSHCDRLPAEVVERLGTIAELAIRLRETIRRLSNAWDLRPERAAHPPAERPSRTGPTRKVS
jgi:signal transduction histidine kinase